MIIVSLKDLLLEVEAKADRLVDLGVVEVEEDSTQPSTLTVNLKQEMVT